LPVDLYYLIMRFLKSAFSDSVSCIVLRSEKLALVYQSVVKPR
jgi:hypothetical protein